MTYTTKNQFANMLERRARDLEQIRARIESECPRSDPMPAVLTRIEEAIALLTDAMELLRYTPPQGDLISAAQAAADAHQPGLPPGGGQPDLF